MLVALSGRVFLSFRLVGTYLTEYMLPSNVKNWERRSSSKILSHDGIAEVALCEVNGVRGNK